MSAPEPGVLLGESAPDIVEIGARGASAGGIALPEFGHCAATAAGGLVLCVRPGRSLVLGAGTAAGEYAAPEYAAVDLSSAYRVLHLSGPAVRDALARSCRLDLDPRVFRAGCAAATIVAQVSVILAALPPGLVLLTPSTTARHFREWFEAQARPFGFAFRGEST